MPGAELLVAWEDLIDSALVDEEVPIDRDDGDHWTIVNDFLLNSFFFLCHTVVSDFELGAVLGWTLTFLGALQRGRVRVTALLHQSVDLSIVQGSRDKAFLASLVDHLVAGQGSLGWQHWVFSCIQSAPSVIDDWNWSNCVRRRTVALRNDGSLTSLVLFSEVVAVRQSGLFISFVADVQLLFVRCLVIDQRFGINQFIVIKQRYGTNGESCS